MAFCTVATPSVILFRYPTLQDVFDPAVLSRLLAEPIKQPPAKITPQRVSPTQKFLSALGLPPGPPASLARPNPIRAVALE